MIREHDRVVLLVAHSVCGLEPSDLGVVVHIYPRQEVYEVEWMTRGDGSKPPAGNRAGYCGSLNAEGAWASSASLMLKRMRY
jgi:hypothetical protein